MLLIVKGTPGEMAHINRLISVDFMNQYWIIQITINLEWVINLFYPALVAAIEHQVIGGKVILDP